MPVSRSRNFVFIHIPKTAGSSVVQALSSADPDLSFAGAGLWDLVLRRPDSADLVRSYRSVFAVGTLATAQQQHLPARILRRLVGRDVWESCFKFAFVRNPWDMLVSGYHYQMNALSEAERAQNPDVFEILSRCRDFSDVVRAYPLIRSDMTSFFTDEEGETIVDFVGRYETLERDFAYVCERLGIDYTLPHENSSEHRPYREYYTGETREIVERHFKRDIERFEYAF